MLIEALDVDDVMAHLLITEGFSSVEEVAYVPLEDLTGIEGVDEGTATELQSRARVFLEEQDRRNTDRRKELGVADELAAVPGVTSSMQVILGEKGVKTLDDLADLAADELIEMVGKEALSEEDANAIIMAARAHWFADDAVPAGAAKTQGEGHAA
jgi:N utilization substance protein A